MPSLEELIFQKREVEERKLALEKCRLELARIQSNINATIYRANSTRVTDYDIQHIKALEAQKKSTVAGLKKDYQLTPHRIPEQIKEYNHQISRIRMRNCSPPPPEGNLLREKGFCLHTGLTTRG